jgi:hypothetical protein
MGKLAAYLRLDLAFWSDSISLTRRCAHAYTSVIIHCCGLSSMQIMHTHHDFLSDYKSGRCMRAPLFFFPNPSSDVACFFILSNAFGNGAHWRMQLALVYILARIDVPRAREREREREHLFSHYTHIQG